MPETTPNPPPREAAAETICERMDEWAALKSVVNPEFADAWHRVRFAIEKSCLLSRTLYGGERPSQTPCPVHKGKWAGIHHGWPGATWSDGSAVKESPSLRAWYDAGCRCFQHGCGCTTGWNVDEHCGCARAAAPEGKGEGEG